MLTTVGRNTALDAIGEIALYVAAHDAYPEPDGTQAEIPGTRTAITWLPTVDGIKVTVGAPQITISQPATVRWFSLWTSLDDYEGCVAITPSAERALRYLVDADADTVTPEDATGIAEDDPIVFWGVDAPPAPLQNGTVYYALNVANGSFQLAEEPAGAAIDITEGSPFSPDMWLAKLEPVTFALPGTLDVQGLSFDGTGV